MSNQLKYVLFLIVWPIYITIIACLCALFCAIAIPYLAIIAIIRTPDYDKFVEVWIKKTHN